MNNFRLSDIIRENILEMAAYSSARDEFEGKDLIFLDANESPFNEQYNRYPDPKQKILKNAIADLLVVPPSKIFLGNGSDEAIDLLIRACCEPLKDKIISIAPSYGMYRVCAALQNCLFEEVLLEEDFSLNSDRILKIVDSSTKLIFLCSPNNPSGNCLDTNEVLKILRLFRGIVVVDEAYIDFADSVGLMEHLPEFKNLVILRTFSKAWGSAAARCGMAFGDPELIGILEKIKYPYNLSQLTQDFILKTLEKKPEINRNIQQIIRERDRLSSMLRKIPQIEMVYASDANFLLIKVHDANGLYQSLLNNGIVVRNRSSMPLCEGCLRITIGTENENQQLITTSERILS